MFKSESVDPILAQNLSRASIHVDLKLKDLSHLQLLLALFVDKILHKLISQLEHFFAVAIFKNTQQCTSWFSNSTTSFYFMMKMAKTQRKSRLNRQQLEPPQLNFVYLSGFSSLVETFSTSARISHVWSSFIYLFSTFQMFWIPPCHPQSWHDHVAHYSAALRPRKRFQCVSSALKQSLGNIFLIQFCIKMIIHLGCWWWLLLIPAEILKSPKITWSPTNSFGLLCCQLLAQSSKSVIPLCLSERRFGSQLRPAEGGPGDPGGQRAFPAGPWAQGCSAHHRRGLQEQREGLRGLPGDGL